MTLHVGVRRVILYYANQLESQGWDISFGTPKKGQIFLGHISKREVAGGGQLNFVPHWASNGQKIVNVKNTRKEYKTAITWTDQIIDPDDYDVNVVTAPWICNLGIPPMPNVIGIVYDLVPNLLASSCLRFPTYLDIYDFAQQHDLGFCYYLANAQRVICISDSTRIDFLNLYKTANQLPSLVTDIPFDCKIELPLAINKVPTVLLVNVLDWRKNLKNIELILIKAASRKNFNLRIVGKERIDLGEVHQFFSNMTKFGIDVEWYRDVDDDVLATQYAQASVLLFPSIYEGLGLPILEAQEVGVPVITSNISSCPEVNMNQNLCFDPNDIEGMASAVVDIIDGQASILRGDALRGALSCFLSSKRNPLEAFTLR